MNVSCNGEIEGQKETGCHTTPGNVHYLRILLQTILFVIKSNPIKSYLSTIQQPLYLQFMDKEMEAPSISVPCLRMLSAHHRRYSEFPAEHQGRLQAHQPLPILSPLDQASPQKAQHYQISIFFPPKQTKETNKPKPPQKNSFRASSTGSKCFGLALRRR